MAGEDLIRMVPILSVQELAPVVAFYALLGLHVKSDYGEYVAEFSIIDPAGTLVRVGSLLPE